MKYSFKWKLNNQPGLRRTMAQKEPFLTPKHCFRANLFTTYSFFLWILHIFIHSIIHSIMWIVDGPALPASGHHCLCVFVYLCLHICVFVYLWICYYQKSLWVPGAVDRRRAGAGRCWSWSGADSGAKHLQWPAAVLQVHSGAKSSKCTSVTIQPTWTPDSCWKLWHHWVTHQVRNQLCDIKGKMVVVSGPLGRVY